MGGKLKREQNNSFVIPRLRERLVSNVYLKLHIDMVVSDWCLAITLLQNDSNFTNLV